MEAVALLLNTLVSRILLSDFTMWLVFLFIGFAFIPPEVVFYLNPKTPAFFPEWFSLSNMASVIFSFVAFMIWHPLSKLLKSRMKQFLVRRKELNKLESLSDDEMQIIYEFTDNHFDSIAFIATPTVISLLAKGVIIKESSQFGAEAKYRLSPKFKRVFLAEFSKSAG
ncbi:hypothetical protein BMT54_01885 [Pasteurellaceae bacterium 15-036681]|nr:hypothetical protein BMT54_01885 [Pasteurellaceae bacterium 15-036681]